MTRTKRPSHQRLLAALRLWLIAIAFLMAAPVLADGTSSALSKYLPDVSAADLVAGADGFGPIRSDLAVAPVLKGGQAIGWVYVTSDFVGTTGYSGKPIHTMVAIDTEAKVIGVKLVKHSEPIVLIGIPDAKIKALAASYIGMDLVAEATANGTGHKLHIISGATVTVMVIDDSIVRSGVKVARALGLGGLAAEVRKGPTVELDPEAKAPSGWLALQGDGTVRGLSLDVGQVNDAFAALDDKRAAEVPMTDPPSATFTDMQLALVSVPAIGVAVLGDAEAANLQAWLKPGEAAVMIAGRGIYSFKGSGYVRGGIFDRIVLVQDDVTVRFHDKEHKRLVVSQFELSFFR